MVTDVSVGRKKYNKRKKRKEKRSRRKNTQGQNPQNYTKILKFHYSKSYDYIKYELFLEASNTLAVLN